jgi:hypothetical protein
MMPYEYSKNSSVGGDAPQWGWRSQPMFDRNMPHIVSALPEISATTARARFQLVNVEYEGGAPSPTPLEREEVGRAPLGGIVAALRKRGELIVATERKCIGFCLLCGEDILVDPALEDPWQDTEAWIPGTSTHNCEPGRILRDRGSDALDAWFDGRYSESYQADLDQFHHELTDYARKKQTR